MMIFAYGKVSAALSAGLHNRATGFCACVANYVAVLILGHFYGGLCTSLLFLGTTFCMF